MSAIAPERPVHGGLQHTGPKRKVVHQGLAPWDGWPRARSEWQAIVRWIERILIQPVGVGAGEPMKVAKFQRVLLKQVCDALATFISIPAGNGKTTLMAAVALERMCRGDDYVEVDVLATNEHQAERVVETAIHMLECVPELLPDFDFYKKASLLEYRPTGSKMTAHPAKLSSVQGLNSDLALIDEIGIVPPELVTSMLARLGKKPGQRVVGFGTPGWDQDNMLEKLRTMFRAGDLPGGVEFIEFSADAGCDLFDRAQWRKANPAIGAGFLSPESMPVKAALMPEFEFRSYHLGQPVDSSGPWLPFGAWDACFTSAPPPDGSAVVLALWGNYRRQVALVGSTLDGSIFFGWQAEKPSDDDVFDMITRAAEQWEIVELAHKSHIRHSLMARLEDDGLPVEPWPTDVATDVDSTAGFYQAIAEQTIAHDHDELLAEQVSRLTAKVDRNGNPRLVESSDEDVSAALAARAAWWRARALAEADPTEELMIF